MADIEKPTTTEPVVAPAPEERAPLAPEPLPGTRTRLAVWPEPEPAAAAPAKPVESPAPAAPVVAEPVKAAAPPEPAPTPKKKETPEARIATATYRQREAERREQAASVRLAEAEAELARLRTASPPAAEEPPPEKVPEKFPTWDEWTAQAAHEGQTYEDYMDARADFRAAQRGLLSREQVEEIAEAKAQEKFERAEQERAEAAEAAAAEQRRTAFFTAKEEAKTKHDDFTEKVDQSELEVNVTMKQFLERSGPMAGELLYFLGTHPEECQRISQLETVAEVISAMTRIQVGLEGASRGPSASPRSVTKAPAPIQPLGTAGTTSGTAALASMSVQEYIRTRNAEERARAGRM